MKVLCLLTYGRGGSKLFHSLLDWHPDIMCFPRTLQFNGFWKGIEAGKSDPEFVVDAFIKREPRFFSGKAWRRADNKYDKADELGPGRDETFSVDTEKFKNMAIREIGTGEVTRAHLFMALHRAYHEACGRAIPRDPLILYHIHAIEFADDLKACLNDFPGSTYTLVITRHPVDSLKSVVNVMRMRNILSTGQLLFQHKRILRYMSHLGSLPADRTRCLTYEALLMHHKAVMLTFCDWIGIGWDDSLTRTTMHGKTWWGNGKVPRADIGPGFTVYEPKGFFENKDWLMFRGLIGRRMSLMGYLTKREEEQRTGKVVLLGLIVLPTASEWS
ncbi:MAG: sulfotransferase, partial [Candidatus Omnitrophota bacterium]